jgi:hypothetical protein
MNAMKKYNISGIKIGFNFQYKDYFEDNIEIYQIDKDETIDYQLTVETKPFIALPKGKPTITYKNRNIYDLGQKESIIVFDEDNQVKQQIQYTKDLKTISITMTKKQKHTLAEMEYVLSGLFFLEIAINEYKLPFHASAIKYKKQAILFSAPSGGGKSTHANYWRIMYNDVEYINDDKPLIYKENNTFYVSGSPWSGKETINTNTSAPLKAIVFIEKSETNSIKQMSSKEALPYLIRNSMRPRQETLVAKAMTIIDGIATTIPLYLLKAKNDTSSVTCVYKKLFQEGVNNEN